ncbi:MAG: hypothetical protein WBV82_33180 [Myxococcaceae bacterium]
MRSFRIVLAGCAAFLFACGQGAPGSDGGVGGGPPRFGGGGKPDAGTADVTWHRDVQPIVQESCLGCHGADGIGPFPLETYEQVSSMRDAVAGAVKNRRMPPWTPDPDCNSYLDERRLTQAQIETLTAWASAGAPKGDPADAPPPPEGRPELPWVDATLDTGFDYTPSTAAPDDHHCFMLDPANTSAKDVIGFDIVPGVRRMVHHVLLYAADKAEAVIKDSNTPEPGWTCFGGPGTQNAAVVGGWVPGTPVTQYPADTGIRIGPGQALVMQVHYNTRAGTAADRTQVKLQYAKSPVPKPALISLQAEGAFSIPPNSTGYTVTHNQTVPVGVTVYGMLPHMHTLGRRIQVGIKDGACLVDIPSWDFHWQQFYMLKEPIQVPAGSQGVVTCSWDNPTGRTVAWGEGTSDEMCLNYYYVTVP